MRVAHVDMASSVPQYELRTAAWGPGDDEMEVWQVPAPATPHLRAPVRVAGLRGRNLELVQHRVLRRLAEGGVRMGPRAAELGLGEPRAFAVNESMALTLGLLFRVLAPMRSRDNMLKVADGIEAMGREEAAYWLGMAMHRSNPRRVLSALRMLLTDPARPAGAR
jgi:hypothetical protein